MTATDPDIPTTGKPDEPDRAVIAEIVPPRRLAAPPTVPVPAVRIPESTTVVIVPAAHPSVHSPFEATIRRWVSNRSLVIGLLLLCGPIGLPVLWISPRFSTLTKSIVSVLFFLMVVVMPIAVSWYWLEVRVRPLVDAFESAANR